jgi:transposase-like protein
MDITSTPTPIAETDIRMCPYCRNRSVVALGHVTAGTFGVRSDYCCPKCSKEFVLLR